MRLHELRPPEGAVRERKRIGRGHGSGKVKTAGKGYKGQKARAGGGVSPYFEGGQLPIVRRLPYRRGFVNPNRVAYYPVNVQELQKLPSGSAIGPDELIAAGLVHNSKQPVKVLGHGELTVALTVRAHKFSKSAREKIEAAGGTAEEIS